MFAIQTKKNNHWLLQKNYAVQEQNRTLAKVSTWDAIYYDSGVNNVLAKFLSTRRCGSVKRILINDTTKGTHTKYCKMIAISVWLVKRMQQENDVSEFLANDQACITLDKKIIHEIKST